MIWVLLDQGHAAWRADRVGVAKADREPVQGVDQADRDSAEANCGPPSGLRMQQFISMYE
jgi:hypothetical protein